MVKRNRFIISSALLLSFLLLAVPAFAQYGGSTGNLYGRVVDEQGNALPGVGVTLTGCGAPRPSTSGAQGDFHYLNLSPCTYTVKTELAGFATIERQNVVVSVGTNTDISISMKIASVATTVTVVSEQPLIDTRKVDTGAVITQAELNSIPTGRDPWVILQSTPGVMVDRVNVAGSESGQQATFMSKGAVGGTFVVDGVSQTDVSVGGAYAATTPASAGYFDFGSFQEIQVNTGGSDVTLQGTGAHLNMITKRGTNEVHGSARIFDVDHRFESTNSGTGTAGARSVDSIQEYGVEAGGPLWTDHLWLWGSYGRDQINIKTGTSLVPNDKTTLENLNGKLNWQIIPSNSATIWGERKDKLKFGRGAGAGRDTSTTEDQTTPQNTWKLEDSQVVGSNLFLTARYSGVTKGDFTLNPEAGPNPQVFRDAGGNWHGGYYFLDSRRPQRQVATDASYFFNTGSAGHEVKAGFQYLRAEAQSKTGFTGTAINGQAAKTIGDLYDCAVACAQITRDESRKINERYYSAFLQDTVSLDRLTVNVGVRWDRQYGTNSATTAPANPSFPTILPELVYGGQGRQFTWKDWSPRFGLTYALGPERKTLLKASYARFADTLGANIIGRTNPAANQAYAYYGWNDGNGDNIVQPNEVDLSHLLFGRGYNLQDPGNPGVPSDGIDRNLKSPQTDEVIVGVDHELLPDLAVGLSGAYRKYKRLLALEPYDAATGRILTRADHVQYGTLTGTLPDGTSYSEPVYQVNPAVLATLTGGVYPGGLFIQNQPGYTNTYYGADLTITKRLSNHWMARANFNYNTFKQNGCFENDPNDGNVQSGTNYIGGSCRNGDFVSIQSTGSGNHLAVFLNAKYVFNLNALYQLPLGFNIAGSFFGRQGFPKGYYVQTTGPDDGATREIGVVPVDSQRYKNLYQLDLRIEKIIPITQTATLSVSADCFNASNNDTILQVRNRINSPTFNTVREVQNPRTWRFGARLSF